MTTPHHNITIAFTTSLAAVFMLVCMVAFSKLASPYYTPIEVAFWRNFIGFIPMAIAAWWKFRTLFPPMTKPGAMIWRSALGSMSLTLSFAAYAALPMTDANAIMMSASLLLMVFAHFFLKERITKYRAAAIFLGFIGVVIVAQPSGAVSGHGVLLAFSAVFCMAIMRTLLSHLGKTENPISMTFYFMLGGTIITAIPMIFTGHTLRLDTLWLLIAVALCGVTGQFLNSVAYKYGDASFIGIMVYTQLLFSIPFDYFIWHHVPTVTTLIGGTIIIGSNAFILFYEKYKKKKTALSPEDQVINPATVQSTSC